MNNTFDVGGRSGEAAEGDTPGQYLTPGVVRTKPVLSDEKGCEHEPTGQPF